MMKIVPVTAAIGSGLLYWIFIGKAVRPAVRSCLVALFLLNPSTVYLSGMVMADTFFVCLTLAVFCLLRRMHKDSTIRWEWALGILLAWSAFMRPEGILLVLSVLASFLSVKKYRSLPGVLLPTIALGTAWLGRNLILTQHLSGYSDLWKLGIGALSNRELLLTYWERQAITWFWELLGGISFGSQTLWWLILSAVTGGIMAVWGFFLWLQEKNEVPGFVLSIGIFAGMFLALHAVWLAVHPHYFFPLLPISLLFLAKAAEVGKHQGSRLSIIGIVGVTLASVAYGAQDYHQVFSSKRMPSGNLKPTSTLAWIKAHAPRDEAHKILSIRAPTVTLYTDCYSLAAVQANNVEKFRFELLKNGVSHILIEPIAILFVDTYGTFSPVRTWEQTPHWLAGWPKAFHQVFQDRLESTQIYEVIADPAFLAAYERYQEASHLLASGRTQAGMILIEEALRIDPQLTSALNSYAAVEIESGQSSALAESRLRAAIRLRPDFELAKINLARILQMQNRTK